MKKPLRFILSLLLTAGLLAGCAGQATPAPTAAPVTAAPKEIPTLSIGYMFSNHQTPLIVAAAKHEAFKTEGVYLKELVPKEKYVLMSEDQALANINVVMAENGGEVMTLMTQGHLQLGISSVGLPLTTMDKGHPMQVLGPIHTDGIALVMDKDSPLNHFDDFVQHVQSQKTPVKIGYHSPANAPVILFEKATKEYGLSVTENPEDIKADILLVNLKGTANLIPALQSKEVDGWIGPSPFPELATIEKTGKIIFDLRDLPPAGKWHNFPCCVFSANSDAIAAYPEEIRAFYSLLTTSAEFANANKEETGKIVAEWMGVNEEAAKNTLTHFTTVPSDLWMTNVQVTFDALKSADKFSGTLKDKNFSDIVDTAFNLSFSK